MPVDMEVFPKTMVGAAMQSVTRFRDVAFVVHILSGESRPDLLADHQSRPFHRWPRWDGISPRRAVHADLDVGSGTAFRRSDSMVLGTVDASG